MQSTTFIGCQGRFLRSLCKVDWRAFRNIARLSFRNVYARFPKKIIRQYCHVSVWQALCKVILASIWQYCKMTFCQSLLKAVPKTKWQCCHATFLQSLCKFVLASPWQPTQIPRTTFIDCQGRFLHPLCKVI